MKSLTTTKLSKTLRRSIVIRLKKGLYAKIVINTVMGIQTRFLTTNRSQSLTQKSKNLSLSLQSVKFGTYKTRI